MTDTLNASIRVHTHTRSLLTRRKIENQTYDDVILKLIDTERQYAYAIAHDGLAEPGIRGQLALRHMMKKLIDDWLPTSEPNQDYIRRFYYMIGEQAPAWLGELVTDKWWDRWLDETLDDARHLAKEAEEET